MSTINEELNYLEETKSLIKQAIINKGQDITDQDSFRSYVNKIDDISTMNAQTKIVNPTTNTQNVEPDEGFNALNKVIVSGVTNTIDNNIQANNIKTGVTILGVTGNYSGIDTSDATALVNDIVNGKTAYVNGVKLVGNLNTYNSGDVFEQTISMTAGYDSTNNKLILGSNPGQCAFKGGTIVLSCMGNTIATAANITNDKIVLGENIFGVQGTAMVMRGTNLDVNLSTTAQSITPTSPYTGFTVVNIPAVTASIDNNIVAGNIKNGVTILGVTGNYEGLNTSDATAAASNIEIGKTAYVNGTKITGSLNVVDNQGHSVDNADPTDVILNWDMGTALLLQSTYGRQNPVIIKPNDPFYLAASKSTLAGIINLTADKIKLGETILGITGTYSDAMKSYNSETAMNNDIANIQEGEVVKVVNQGITTYYVKEISTTTEYQAVDLSQYEEGDTISIKNMKLNSTVTLPTSVGRMDDRDFTLSYNNIKVLECKITSQISIDYAGVSVNDTDNYMFIDNNPTFSLADNDLQAINSSEIWQSNNQLTISGSEFSDYTGILLEPVEISTEVMTKLVKESETISPQEYEENVDLANDILGEEE